MLAHASFWDQGRNLPVAISRDDIIDPELLTNLFNTQVKSVGLELFAGHVGHDRSWKSHQTSCLVLCGVTPTVSLLATSFSIAGGLISCSIISIISLVAGREVLTSDWAATTFAIAAIRQSGRRFGWIISTIVVLRRCVAAESASVPQRDIVRSCTTLRSPRHREKRS